MIHVRKHLPIQSVWQNINARNRRLNGSIIAAGSKMTYQVLQCHERFQTRGEVYRHRMTAHREPEVPIGDPEELLEHDNPDLVREFETNRSHIYRPHHVQSNPAVYNFPTADLRGGMAEMKDRIQTVFHKESQAFKINKSLGFILRHVTFGRYRYFIPHQNCPLLDYHVSVSSISDLQYFYRELAKAQIRDYTYKDRTSTSWKLAFVCNINIFVYRTNYSLRNGCIPDFIRNQNAIQSLDKTRHGKPYKDQLCTF